MQPPVQQTTSNGHFLLHRNLGVSLLFPLWSLLAPVHFRAFGTLPRVIPLATEPSLRFHDGHTFIVTGTWPAGKLVPNMSWT